MNLDAGLAAWLRLTLTPGIGGESQRRLLAACGLPEAIFASSAASLHAVIGQRASQLLADPPQAAVERALAWAEEPGHHILTLIDANYPQILLDTPDPPTVLYVLGDPALLNRHCLAVVGSRNATPQGLRNAREFSGALAQRGWHIVSGLALGIDTAAHQGALAAGGCTLAVIGTGIDRVTRREIMNWRNISLPGGQSSPNFHWGRRQLPATFLGATASLPACRVVCW